MFFRFFKKHSIGRKEYGYGFAFMFKHHTFLIGTKKREYRSSKKNYKDFAKKIWRRKKFFVSYRKQ
tara:strand:+ start:31 stop:228 length:198 start_codon:yes stop_codon:yes gene_type:complete